MIPEHFGHSIRSFYSKDSLNRVCRLRIERLQSLGHKCHVPNVLRSHSKRAIITLLDLQNGGKEGRRLVSFSVQESWKARHKRQGIKNFAPSLET